MRLARAITWLFPALLIAMGAGFLIWGVAQSQDANAYRSAPQCGAQVTAGCYQLFAGRITSVEVSQSRDGQRDAVMIDTPSDGTLTATLMPSAAEAPHVRTGADVTAKVYRGHVTLVEVDGFVVASTANPAANQSSTEFDGWLLVGIGVASGVFSLVIRRSAERHVADELDSMTSTAKAAGEVLMSGGVGWLVRPRFTGTMLLRYAVVPVMLLVLTLRALLDPARAGGALLLDSIVVGGMVVLLALFRRNARVFANKEAVGKTDLFGRTVTFGLREIARADRFSVSGGAAMNRHLVFVRNDGSKAFEVAGPTWDYGQLARLCRSGGIELTGDYLDTVGAFKVNKRIRGALGWNQLWIGLGLVVLIVAFVLVTSGPTSR